MAETLAAQISDARVPMATLETRYRPMLELVRQLIGVAPNCDELLEIWPTGFRTYNLIVPNSLNLPVSLWGRNVPKDLVGLGMYVSSRAAGCPYCTAHTCSFAMRRGTSVEAMTGNRSPVEVAVTEYAEAVAQVPAYVTADHVAALRRHLDEGQVEAVVMGTVMMGFLNKFMDVVGVELEDEALLDVGSVLGPTGWSPGKHVEAGYELPTDSHRPKVDSAATYLQVIRQAPGAIRMERRWVKGVPNRSAESAQFLATHAGHAFPLVGKLPSRRLIRAITTVLRDNLDPKSTSVGLPTKALAGLVFATVVGNEYLVEENTQLVRRYLAATENVGTEGIHQALEVAQELGESPFPQDEAGLAEMVANLSDRLHGVGINASALIFSRAAAPSPAEVSPAVLARVTPKLAPAQAIEVAVWLSVQQYLHRFERFVAVA